MSEEFDFESIKNKALEQLKSGKPLLGKDGAFAPLLESILNAALEGEMDLMSAFSLPRSPRPVSTAASPLAGRSPPQQ